MPFPNFKPQPKITATQIRALRGKAASSFGESNADDLVSCVLLRAQQDIAEGKYKGTPFMYWRAGVRDFACNHLEGVPNGAEHQALRTDIIREAQSSGESFDSILQRRKVEAVRRLSLDPTNKTKINRASFFGSVTVFSLGLQGDSISPSLPTNFASQSIDSAEIMSLFDKLGPLGDFILREAMNGDEVALARIKHWARVAADDQRYFDLQERKFKYGKRDQYSLSQVWLFPERASDFKDEGLDVVKLEWDRDAEPSEETLIQLRSEPAEKVKRLASPENLPKSVRA